MRRSALCYCELVRSLPSLTKEEAIILYEKAIQEKTQPEVEVLYEKLNAKRNESGESTVIDNEEIVEVTAVPEEVLTEAVTETTAEEPEVIIPSIYELDRLTKKNIPPLDYGAHIYATDNSSGFVILNGARRRAGDRLANGVYIEKIAEEDVILSHNGTVFSLPAMKSWSGE